MNHVLHWCCQEVTWSIFINTKCFIGLTTINCIPIMKHSLLLVVICTFFSSPLFSQSLTIILPSGVDTTGLSASEILSLEHAVSASLTLSGSGSDTLVVELGPEAGSYDLFRREFPLSQTGTFADGCSLDNSSGLTVGLGKFTGLSEFHVRAYLKSAGVGTAVTLSN